MRDFLLPIFTYCSRILSAKEARHEVCIIQLPSTLFVIFSALDSTRILCTLRESNKVVTVKFTPSGEIVIL